MDAALKHLEGKLQSVKVNLEWALKGATDLKINLSNVNWKIDRLKEEQVEIEEAIALLERQEILNGRSVS